MLRQRHSPMPIRRVGACLALASMLLASSPPRAEARPLLVAHLESGVVTLTDEACALPAVANAPKRVTWLERDGKVVEGCYGRYTAQLSYGEVHLIVGYFADLTLQVLPLSAFTALHSI